MQRKLKTVYFGTPDFSIPTLEILANHPNIDLRLVVTMPDRPAGRGQKLTPPPVAMFAKENKISLWQTENINKEEELLKQLDNENIDLVIVLAFAQFLSEKILNIPKLGCFNIHTSLLPKYRGAAPIQHAIMNGDKVTGVSIQKMVKKMDAGDIVYFQETPIEENETGGMLYTRLKFLAGLSTTEFLKIVFENRLSFQTQDESMVSLAPSIDKKDGLLDFVNMDANTIFNRVRGLNPRPGCFFTLDIDGAHKRLKVFSAEISDYKLTAEKIFIEHGALLVGTKNGTVRLTEIQMEGKNRCSDTTFLNGISNHTSLKISESKA